MLLRRLVPGLLALSYLSCLAGCDAGSSSGDDSTGTAPATLLGCTVTTPPAVAPGGYYTNGRTVCTAAGEKHVFRGVARPSLEWSPAGDRISPADFQTMASWHANVVRIALNQDFWLSGAALYDSSYQTVVDGAVKAAEAAGLDVILDLHWSDEGNLGVTASGGTMTSNGQDTPTRSNQQPMADVNSQEFWKEVATKYKDDGHVLFELYNEPHNVPWAVWLNGGMYGGASPFQVVGMQQLYQTVRDTGANNIVIAGGLGFAFDLSGVGGNKIKGYNVMYASHPYKPQDGENRWESSFGYLATGDIAPVITTEFGDTTKTTCTGQWNTDLIKFNDDHEISWTAWAWYVADPCGFPSVISDWSGTPSVQGVPVKAALLGYDYQPGGKPVATAGSGGTGAGGHGGAGSGGAGDDEAGAAGASVGGSGGAAAGSAGASGAAAGSAGTGGAAAGGSAGTGGATGGTGGSGSAGVGGIVPA